MEQQQTHRCLQALCAICLALLISLGGIGCIMTAFALPGNWTQAWLFCLCAGVVLALCYSFRHGGWAVLPLLAALLWYLKTHPGWLLHLESLLFTISNCYDNAYHWGVIFWSGETLTGQPVLLALELMSLLPCFAVIRTVLHRRSAIPALLWGMAPLGVCMVINDAIPERLPLAVLLLGLLLVLLTQSSRRQNAWQGCKLTLLLLGPVEIVLLALLMLLPQQNYTRTPLADRIQQNMQGWFLQLPFVSETPDQRLTLDFSGSGVESQVDLASLGPRMSQAYQVMEVTADTGGPLYLRGQSMGVYTGTGWEMGQTGFDQRFLPSDRFYALGCGDIAPEDGGLVKVKTKRTKELFYTPYYPKGDQWLSLLEGDAYLANPDQRTEYSFQRLIWPQSGLVSFPNEAYPLMAQYWDYVCGAYLDLPSDTSAWAGTFLRERELLPQENFPAELSTILGVSNAGDASDNQAYSEDNSNLSVSVITSDGIMIDGGTYYDTVESAEASGGVVGPSVYLTMAHYYRTAERIGAWLRSHGAYDLNPSRMPSEETDFVRWFLENNDAGYCTHYASSAVVLLRAAGIPARFVTGYLAQVRPGEPAAVTGDHAHAWAEYFLPFIGWVVLDATPGQSQTSTAQTLPTTATTDPETQENSQATEDSTRPSTEPKPTEQPGGTSVQGPAKTTPSPLVQRLLAVGVWLLRLAAVLAALWLQSRLRLRLRKSWLCHDSINQQAIYWWRYACRLARLEGNEPPEPLHQLALRAKFSGHTLTQEQLETFPRWCEQTRLRLAKKPWHWRLFYRIALALW